MVGIVIGLLLPKPAEPESPLTAERENVMAGLLACLAADSCLEKRTVEMIEGQPIFGIYHKMPEKGVNIKYAFQTGALAMTVVIVKDSQNQLSISDIDMDGVADIVVEVTDGVVATFGPLDPAYQSDYMASQLLYELALQTAWEKLIPEMLRKSLVDNPDISRYPS